MAPVAGPAVAVTAGLAAATGMTVGDVNAARDKGYLTHPFSSTASLALAFGHSLPVHIRGGIHPATRQVSEIPAGRLDFGQSCRAHRVRILSIF